jgi:aminoglycoside 3-N-acetyltransferase
LLLGVGWNRASALHTAETLAKPRRLKKRRFLDTENEWRETEDVADDGGRLFPVLGEAFEETGACSYGVVGKSDARLCDYAQLVQFATTWISKANQSSGDLF